MTIKRFFTLIILVLLTTNCKKEAIYDLPSLSEGIVVNSLLISDSVMNLQVSTLANFGETIDKISYSGDLILSCSSGISDTLKEISPGNYYSSILLQNEQEYILNGNSSLYPISCSEKTPDYPEVVKTVKLDTAGYDTEGYAIAETRISIQDEIGKDYYEVKLQILSEEGKKYSLSLYTEKDEVLLNEGLPFYETTALPFSDELFDGKEVEVSFNYITPKRNSYGVMEEKFPSYKILAEIRKTSESYYRYRKSQILHEQSKWPDFWDGMGNPNNIYSNINGSYGIFAAYSSVIIEIEKSK